MQCPVAGTPEQGAVLRTYFSRCGFTEKLVSARLGLKSAEELDLSTLTDHPPTERKAADRLDTLIFLFILGEFLDTTEAVSFFPGTEWNTMVQTGLVCLDKTDGRRCFATVALYPIRDLYIASDRWVNPDQSPAQSFPDIVYPALTRGAREFLNYSSFEPCGDFLEICAGSAASALLAARSSRHVWATDIAERSTQFAKFNAALNGICNVTIAQGDLYEPFADKTFDRIVAHPPYMPVLRPAEIYYGGGEDGEEITRRVIAEVPPLLRPRGRLYCRTLGTDRPDNPFERRVREWLGGRQAEFDIALIVFRTVEPRQFAMEDTVRKQAGSEELAQWGKLFVKHNVETLVTGMVVVQRVSRRRPVFTVRRTLRKGTTQVAIERVIAWETEMQEEGSTTKVLQLRPLAAPEIEFTVRHRLREGELTTVDMTLSTDYPFAMDCKVQPWMAVLLSRCDGKTTIAELFEISKKTGWIVPETPPAEFCRLLAVMISGGFLQSEGITSLAAAR